MKSRIPIVLAIASLLQACAYSRSYEKANPDGSKSTYDFVHDIDLAGPNTVVVRVHDCTETDGVKSCTKSKPEVGHGSGIIEQLAQPAAIVGGAVLWPEDNISATGGSATGGQGGSASSTSTSTATSSSTSSGTKPHHGK